MKKAFFITYILILFCNLLFAQSKHDDFVYKQIEFSEDSIKGKEILEHYGNLWISYKQADETFFSWGKKNYPILVINFYYKKNDKYVFLGKIDTDGIYDKDENMLCGNTLKKDRFKEYEVLGYSELSLNYPFDSSQYYKNHKTGNYGWSDEYAFFTIDFDTDSLKLIRVRE